MKKTFLCGILCCLLILSGCEAKAAEPATREVLAMDTYMTLSAYGEHAEAALDAAEKQILELDKLLSTEDPESEIYQLNETGSGELSAASAYLLERALEVHSMTDGAFNPLIYPLMKAWGFPDRTFHVPDPETIRELLPLLGVDQLTYDPVERHVEFHIPGMMMDLGGIAKGYTSTCLMEIFQNYGIESALVNLGGNVEALGSKPGGEAWKVAIQDPDGIYPYISILEIRDQAVITSGGYERYFEEEGKTYHHILDPETGYPADQGLLSVTIVSSDGTLADALSTALFVLGLDQGSEVWRQNADLFDVVFLTEEHELYVSEGIADALTYAEYPVTVLERGVS